MLATHTQLVLQQWAHLPLLLLLLLYISVALLIPAHHQATNTAHTSSAETLCTVML
jgi:hypothetical protein